MALTYIGPVRGYLSQKSTLRSQEIGLTGLQAQRTTLASELTQLQQPAILETRAREIGMLRPGEQGFVIDFVTPKPRSPHSAPDGELLRRLPGAS